MNPLKSVQKSLFNWEESYFGGYERIVYDHPPINIPKEIGYDFKNTTGCSWFVADKLCRLFLLKISKEGLFTQFLANYLPSEKVMYTGEIIKMYNIDKKSQALCIHGLKKDREIGSLFTHFETFLKRASFYIVAPSDDENKSGGGGDGPSAPSDVLKGLEKVFSEVKESVPNYTNSVSGNLKTKTTFIVVKKDTVACTYSPENIRLANALVNLLDISFEPKEDKIENLLSGKMSPHKISSAIAGDTHIYHKIEPDVSTRPFSICVLGDESGSMKGCSLHRRQNELFKTLYYAFSQILPPQKMFFYGHSGWETPEVRVYHELYHPNFEYTINKQLTQQYSENYDGPVIENVYERVRNQTSDNVIFISISDGQPAGIHYGGEKAIEEMKRVIEKCKRDGFVTMGIGLYYERVKEIYSYYTVINDMSHLVEKVSPLINRVVKTEFKD